VCSQIRKLVVLDRDGVINYDSDEYIKSPDEWRAIPGSIDAIARLGRAAYDVVVVSNQSGIARGLLSQSTLNAINARMTREIQASGGSLAGIYFCPHHPDQGCSCRKPEPGLLLRVARDLSRSMEGVPVIGDKLSDLQAASAVQARPMLVLTGRGQKTFEELDGEFSEVYADLEAAVETLLAEQGVA